MSTMEDRELAHLVMLLGQRRPTARVIPFPFVSAASAHWTAADECEPVHQAGGEGRLALPFMPADLERAGHERGSRPTTSRAPLILLVLVALFYSATSAVLALVFGIHAWVFAPMLFGAFVGWRCA